MFKLWGRKDGSNVIKVTLRCRGEIGNTSMNVSTGAASLAGTTILNIALRTQMAASRHWRKKMVSRFGSPAR